MTGVEGSGVFSCNLAKNCSCFEPLLLQYLKIVMCLENNYYNIGKGRLQ